MRSGRPASERLADLIVPRALGLGMVLAFLACCAAGWVASYRNPYRHFVRFHQLLSPESLFQPTASQLRALIKARVPPGRIAVIVGGSSILHGIGQGVEQLWTRKLEARLGESYRVVNLAMRAGLTTEAGALAAESLTKEGAPVIFVADLSPGQAWSPLGRYYGYMFWDAYYKGLLIDDPARAGWIRELLRNATPRSRAASNELRLGAILDSAFRFNDLWSSLGYRRFFTVWNFIARPGPFRARRTFPDVGVGSRPFAERYPEARLSDDMTGVRTLLDRRRITFDVDGRAVAGDAPGAWEEIRRNLEAGLPAAVRRRTLVIVVPPSPYYVERLTAEDQRRFDELLHGSASVLEEAGYEAVVEGNEFTADDFADMLHLTPSGGAKLADLVAPRVAAMAEQLGYLR
jgi:hypothetical protein